MSSTEQFIERIKIFEQIYDKQNANYSNSKEKEQLWKNLSKEFNCDAKKKWNALRDKYVREKKKSRSSGAEFHSDWDYYEHMDFIDNHIKPRRKIEDSEFAHARTEEVDVKEFYDDFIFSEFSEATNNAGSSTANFYDVRQDSKRRKTSSIQQTILKTLQIFQEKIKNIEYTDDYDEDTVFMQLMAKKMKKMSSNEKSKFQLEILKTAKEILNEKN